MINVGFSIAARSKILRFVDFVAVSVSAITEQAVNFLRQPS